MTCEDTDHWARTPELPIVYQRDGALELAFLKDFQVAQLLPALEAHSEKLHEPVHHLILKMPRV